MEPARPNRAVVYALCANAVLLFAILIVLLARGGNGGIPESIAFAAAPPNGAAAAAAAPQPIAGGPGGLYLMPGQMQKERWGCFVMDVNRETLIAYEYFPGTRQLQLAAARSIHFDRSLEDFNTDPSPRKIQQLLNAANRPRGGGAGAGGGGAAAPQGNEPLNPDH